MPDCLLSIFTKHQRTFSQLETHDYIERAPVLGDKRFQFKQYLYKTKLNTEENTNRAPEFHIQHIPLLATNKAVNSSLHLTLSLYAYAKMTND